MLEAFPTIYDVYAFGACTNYARASVGLTCVAARPEVASVLGGQASGRRRGPLGQRGGAAPAFVCARAATRVRGHPPALPGEPGRRPGRDCRGSQRGRGARQMVVRPAETCGCGGCVPLRWGAIRDSAGPSTTAPSSRWTRYRSGGHWPWGGIRAHARQGCLLAGHPAGAGRGLQDAAATRAAGRAALRAGAREPRAAGGAAAARPVPAQRAAVARLPPAPAPVRWRRREARRSKGPQSHRALSPIGRGAVQVRPRARAVPGGAGAAAADGRAGGRAAGLAGVRARGCRRAHRAQAAAVAAAAHVPRVRRLGALAGQRGGAQAAPRLPGTADGPTPGGSGGGKLRDEVGVRGFPGPADVQDVCQHVCDACTLLAARVDNSSWLRRVASAPAATDAPAADPAASATVDPADAPLAHGFGIFLGTPARVATHKHRTSC